MQQGVTKKTQKPGDGKTFPQKGQTVAVHYRGELMDGTTFDSSVGKKPFTFRIGVGQVIRGWDEGVATMSVGEVALLRISPEYGYGAMGAPPSIPSNAELMFQVQLLGVQ
jgi:FK506-binding protein 1